MGNLITTDKKALKSPKKAILCELVRLRTVYPSQIKNYTAEEIEILQATWSEVFAETSPQVLSEAVMRFIKTDHKGIFPTPGQIMAIIKSFDPTDPWKNLDL